MDLSEISASQSVWDVFALYWRLGYIHILPGGLDHILFVSALFFATQKLKPLVWQVSAFTLAHTLTLGAAMTGLVAVPAHIVEPVIALSIAFVAIENVFIKHPDRWRPAIIFVFGLFHGLGFAGALTEMGIAPGHFLPSLLGFNIGVEAGQLTVIAAYWLALHRFQEAHRYPPMMKVVSGLIALIAIWWTIERVFFS
jgi:hypothetical protein